MSGGVDSSVAAAFLRNDGYDVVGITMKTWDYSSSGGRSGKEVGCCSLESMNDARSIAIKMDFPHFIIDIRKEFGDWVIDRFVEEYLGGRTPNPCVLCNTHIKWAALLRRADDLGCEFIATGHYARVRYDESIGRHIVSRGKDTNKDQSYALWGLPQEHLARSIFPLGEFTKPAIRRMAAEYGLDRVADKPDSYEICFVPDNNYRRFLKDRVPGLEAAVSGGRFMLEDGTVVGTHKGYPFFTIGQRRGLGITNTEPDAQPLYVIRIDPDNNIVTLGARDQLLSQELVARNINLVKYPDLFDERLAIGKIRYKDDGAPALVWQSGDDELRVAFTEPRSAITPGQSVVLYEDDDVLGGGWIHEVPVGDDRNLETDLELELNVLNQPR